MSVKKIKLQQPTTTGDTSPAGALPELRRQLAQATSKQELLNIKWLIRLAEGKGQ